MHFQFLFVQSQAEMAKEFRLWNLPIWNSKMRNCRAFVIETAKPPGVGKCGPISRLCDTGGWITIFHCNSCGWPDGPLVFLLYNCMPRTNLRRFKISTPTCRPTCNLNFGCEWKTKLNKWAKNQTAIVWRELARTIDFGYLEVGTALLVNMRGMQTRGQGWTVGESHEEVRFSRDVPCQPVLVGLHSERYRNWLMVKPPTPPRPVS